MLVLTALEPPWMDSSSTWSGSGLLSGKFPGRCDCPALLCLALVRALLGLGAPKGGGLWGVELATVRSKWQTPSFLLL